MPTTKKRSTSKTTSRKTTSRSKSAGGNSKHVSDVMTPDPVTMIESETIQNAARAMRENDIGDVIVLDDTSARIKGIVTDRDMVVRAIADDRDPTQTTLAAICSEKLVYVAPEDSVDKAVKLMREKSLRRLPVVDGDQAVGVVSLGDLALELDRRSALADISGAPANN
ncbi:MAG TPA: CBS domain-containing protein [Actinomycetota bacterium]|jgi:CBS domain-containing protein|nr:CBS domain-containing protein [Actinomycetota bacterium]